MSAQGAVWPGRDLSWLLDDLANRVEHFRRSVILSRDGLVIASSAALGRDDAERLCALAAGMQSLARGAGECFGAGEVRQTIIELEQALLFIAAAGSGSCLAVLCEPDADAGMVAYEMAMLAKRAGPHLASQPRFPGADAAGLTAATQVPGLPHEGHPPGPHTIPPAGDPLPDTPAPAE